MKKTTTETSTIRIRRNSSFVKTMRKDCSKDYLETPCQLIEESKTVRSTRHKKTQIPILKFEGLEPRSRPKLYSIDGSLQKAMATERARELEKLHEDSFNYGQTSILLKTKAKNSPMKDLQNDFETMLKFPPINQQRNVGGGHRKTKNNAQCKVLISRKSPFPFPLICHNPHRHEKKLEKISTTGSSSTDGENESPFEVNNSFVTDIDNVMEPEPFISKESLHELLNF